VLLGSLALFAVSAFVCSISGSFPMLLVCRLMQGCASGIATTLPLAIIRDLLEGSAARQRMSEVTVINNIMPLLAPIIGSWMMLLGSWRLLFAAQGLFAVSIGLILLLDFKETLSYEKRSPLRPKALVNNYLHLIGNRTFLGFALINGLTFACIFSFISVSPLLLIQRMGVDHYEYALMFAAIAAGNVLGAFTSALLNRKQVSVHRIITSGLALMAAASLAACALQLSGYHRPAAVLPPVFAVLFGFGLISPSVTVGALAQVPNLAGSGSGGLRSIFMAFGSGTSAWLATFCARHLNYSEVATTLTMLVEVAAAWSLYALLLRDTEVNTLLESPQV
jgi:DHA1 family bicyclomycin/chloramphenicol resistance-like MFS transporter